MSIVAQRAFAAKTMVARQIAPHGGRHHADDLLQHRWRQHGVPIDRVNTAHELIDLDIHHTTAALIPIVAAAAPKPTKGTW